MSMQFVAGEKVERVSKNPLHTCEMCGDDDVDVMSKGYKKYPTGVARCHECGHERKF